MSLIFLDRDGVINRFPGKGRYVTSIAQFYFLPGAKKAVRLLSDAGHELVVISNQGCVSRGYLTEKKLKLITDRMLASVERAGGRIRKVFYCIHQTADACGCKKPRLGLIRKAVGRRRGLLKKAYFIGDSKEDVETAAGAGCRSILVLSGRSKKKDITDFKTRPDQVKKDILEAAKWILRTERS